MRSLQQVTNLKNQIMTLHDEMADVKSELDSSDKPSQPFRA